MARQSELERLIPRLRRYARGLTGRAQIADDLVQDAILSALRSKGMGSGNALLHRLYAIVTDFNRLRVADRDGVDDYASEPRSAVITLRQPHKALPVQPEAQPVRRNPLPLLSLDEREVLLLVSVEGLTYEAAAAVAGISPLALVARLTSARNRIDAAGSASSGQGEFRPTAHRHLRVVS